MVHPGTYEINNAINTTIMDPVCDIIYEEEYKYSEM